MFITLISATLLGAASPTTAVYAMADAPAAEKKICKREKQIGSMVRKKKTCRTKAEWDVIAEGSRDELDRIQRGIRFPNN
jgi:hypothetical protein